MRTTLVAFVLVLGVLCRPENARGQEALPSAAAPSGTVAADAFVRVEDWLHEGAVPEAKADGKDPTPSFPGVSLWVRAQGRVIARASLMTPPGEQMPDVLQRVVRGVLDQVGAAFDPARFPGMEKQAWVRAVLGGCTATLEVSGPLVPFRADTFDEVDLGISPGVWGVAAAVGQGFDAIFPLNMLSSGMMPGAGLRSTIARASNDPSLSLPGVAAGSPGAIAKSHGATYYRFRTTQVTRLSPDKPPAVLCRGGVIVRKTDLTQGAMQAFADRMAEHLLQRLDVHIAGTGEAMGVLELREVGRQVDDPAQRGPALVALHALSMYQRSMEWRKDDPTPTRVGEAMDRATAMLVQELAREIKDQEEGPGPIEGALIASWLAGREQVRHPKADDASQTADIAAFLAKDLCVAYDAKEDRFDEHLPEPVRGLVALAFVRMAAWDGSGISRDDANRCVRRAFLAVTPGKLSAQMPWLGWAELELAGGSGEIPSAIALDNMRDELYSQAVGVFDAGDEDADMAGGIVGVGGGMLPTWNTARPGAMLATMFADERLTPSDVRIRDLGRLLGVVRFLRQLAVDDAVLALYGDRNEGALWGIRSAGFDLREPGDATSFSLMTVAETLRALRAPAAAGSGDSPDPKTGP